MMKRLLMAGLFLLCFCSFGFAGPIPKLTERVNDFMGILSQSQKTTLSNKIQVLEQSNDHPQMVVLIVPSVPDDDLEKYANDVFHQNKIGDKEHDNGVLFVLAPNQRRMRLEVGYGLEEYIPDGVASTITESSKPFLKKQDYFNAISTVITGVSVRLPKPEGDLKVVTKGSVPISFGEWGIIGALFVGMTTFLWLAFRTPSDRKPSNPTPRPAPPRSQTPNTVYPQYKSPDRRYINKYPSRRPTQTKKSDGSDFVSGVVTGAIVDSILNSGSSSSSDSSSSSSSSSDWGSSSSSDSWSGGGGDSGGGGASSDW